MREYLRDMKHVIEFAAVLAILLVGMTFVVAGNAAVAPVGNNVTLGVAAVVPPRVPPVPGANSRSNFIRPAFVRPAFNPFFAPAINPFFAPAINPFFAPAINPFFAPAINPFFAPAINPFFNAGVDAFGADFD